MATHSASLPAVIPESPVPNYDAHGQIKPIHGLLPQMFQRLLSAPENSRRFPGLSTGYYMLDDMLCGLPTGALTVVSRRHETGGAALALNIAEHVAIHEQAPTLLLSLSHEERVVREQITFSHARLNRRELFESSSSSAGDGKRLMEAALAVTQAPLLVRHLADPTTEYIGNIVRREVDRRGVRLVVLSHYQRVQLPREVATRYEAAHERQSFVSRTLKALAKDANIALLVVSEFSRLNTRNPWRWPLADDLDGSGRLHDDADVVLLLHRSPGAVEWEGGNREVTVRVEKNRLGPVGDFPLLYVPKYGRFENMAFVPNGETAT